MYVCTFEYIRKLRGDLHTTGSRVYRKEIFPDLSRRVHFSGFARIVKLLFFTPPEAGKCTRGAIDLVYGYFGGVLQKDEKSPQRRPRPGNSGLVIY